LSFARLSYFQVVLYLIVLGVGTLVGLELPLLMRILKDTLDFKDLVSRVLTFDYIGALVASLLFPLFLVPKLGLVRTSLAFGILNAVVGLWATWLLEPLIKGKVTALRLRACIVIVLLLIGFIKANTLTQLAEDDLLSTHSHHARPRRFSAFLKRASAIQFRRRISLSRSLSASRDHGCRRQTAQSSSDGRRRRFGFAGNLALPDG
jgi:predicted membrane-bound spermidine synthase